MDFSTRNRTVRICYYSGKDSGKETDNKYNNNNKIKGNHIVLKRFGIAMIVC